MSSMAIKKVFLSVSIATISTFLQKGTLWRHNYGTSQQKFGQCVFYKQIEKGDTMRARVELNLLC